MGVLIPALIMSMWCCVMYLMAPPCTLAISFQAARVGALQQLHQQLFDPASQRQALQQLQTLWPRLLALLYDDSAPAVTAAAAPAVGAIGALAAQAAAAAAAARTAAPGGPSPAASPAASSSASGLLFDWLLPVLQQRASPAGRALEQHQLSAVLLALRDCLTGAPGRGLPERSAAVCAWQALHSAGLLCTSLTALPVACTGSSHIC